MLWKLIRLVRLKAFNRVRWATVTGYFQTTGLSKINSRSGIIVTKLAAISFLFLIGNIILDDASLINNIPVRDYRHDDTN